MSDWPIRERKPDGTVVLYTYPRQWGGTGSDGKPLTPFTVRHYLEFKPLAELSRGHSVRQP